MIVGGGTLAAILISFPLKNVVGVFKILKNVFGAEISDAGAYISACVRLAHKARKESILNLQNDAQNVKNRIMQMGLQLVIDGQPPEIVRAVLETELEVRVLIDRVVSRVECQRADGVAVGIFGG